MDSLTGQTMSLSLFGYSPQTRVVDSLGFASNHQHTFGGDAHDFSISFANAPLPIHLIYRLDLRDPLVPFHLANIEFLPLLYCFNYGTDCCYQIVSDTEITLLNPGSQEHYFPPWDAPKLFPLQRTSFSTMPFDPTNANDVLDWKGVFGWDELTGTDRERALVLARERTSLTATDGPDEAWTFEDVIHSMYDPPFAQSKPCNSCENPNCQDGQLEVIAFQNNVLSSELIWPDKYVQTIWQMCKSCQCIIASNQST